MGLILALGHSTAEERENLESQGTKSWGSRALSPLLTSKAGGLKMILVKKSKSESILVCHMCGIYDPW